MPSNAGEPDACEILPAAAVALSAGRSSFVLVRIAAKRTFRFADED
jgi:hypothetical protein